MKVAAAYIRVSTDDQLEYSPDSQLKMIKEYAQRNSFIIPPEYIFVDEGISGKNTKNRNAFKDMIGMSKLDPPPFSAILVWKFSRFARNQEESITYKSLLRKQRKIDVVSISEPLIDGPFGTLIERIIEWFDEYYSINLAQEVKRGMTEKVARGEPVCHPAFGYDLKDGKYCPNADSDTVRQIFHDYLSGAGFTTIARNCTANGVHTYRGNLPDNRFIEYILRNPVYIGKIRWSPKGRAASKRDYDNPNIMIVDGQHEPIIDINTFDDVQKKIQTQKAMYGKYQRSGQPVNYMLKGLVRCSACGSTLVFVSTKSPSLQCHSYSKGKCSVSHALTLKKADDTVISALHTAIGSRDFNIQPRENQPLNVDYSKLIDAEKNKLKRIKDAYISGIDTLEDYSKNKSEILNVINRLQKDFSGSQKTITVNSEQYAKKVKMVLDIIENPKSSEGAKNRALRTILSKIVYEKENKRVSLFYYV